jgi:hypothetical protein
MTRAELEEKIDTMCRESGLDYDDIVQTLGRLLEQFEQEEEAEDASKRQNMPFLPTPISPRAGPDDPGNSGKCGYRGTS